MIALLQRVTEAMVTVDRHTTEVTGVTVDRHTAGAIGRGLLVFAAVQPDDTEARVTRMAERILTYRVFPDVDGKMNESLLDQGLELLLVPQFTLAADTKKGTRASFTRAASPETGRRYFDRLVVACKDRLGKVECGVFGANMQVRLVNDGPVTFWLEA